MNPTANEACVIEKQHYATPQVTIMGDIAEITLGISQGDELDAVFTINPCPVPRGIKKTLFS